MLVSKWLSLKNEWDLGEKLLLIIISMDVNSNQIISWPSLDQVSPKFENFIALLSCRLMHHGAWEIDGHYALFIWEVLTKWAILSLSIMYCFQLKTDT